MRANGYERRIMHFCGLWMLVLLFFPPLISSAAGIIAGYTSAFGREIDINEVESFILPPTVCQNLPEACRCASGADYSVVSNDMHFSFSGTSVICANKKTGAQSDEPFNALRKMVDEQPTRFSSVMRLDLVDSNVRRIRLTGSFTGLKIKVLDLTDNPITELRSLFFSHLGVEFLLLRHVELTRLTRIANLGLRNLKAIDLSLNEITVIDSDTFMKTNLRYLNLSGNQNLHFYPQMFAGLEAHLELIDLSGTNLRSIPNAFENFGKLRFFYLQHNQISSIDGNQMRLLPLLYNSIYHLEHNQIRWIDGDAFSRHAMPFILYADDNQISDLSFLYKHNPCLFVDVGVSLKQNDIYCGCNLLKFLAYNPLVIEGRCTYPSILHNLDFRHFERKAFLEELFGDPYFAPLAQKCEREMQKNDSFKECRCDRRHKISSVLLSEKEAADCSSASGITMPSLTASFFLPLVLSILQ